MSAPLTFDELIHQQAPPGAVGPNKPHPGQWRGQKHTPLRMSVSQRRVAEAGLSGLSCCVYRGCYSMARRPGPARL